MPAIDVIDFFGMDSVDVARLREALRLRPGDSLPRSIEGARRRLEAVPGVEEAVIEPVCCSERGGTILYVGIRETGAPIVSWREAPVGADTLPTGIVTTYNAFMDALEDAVRRGVTADDLSQGHSLMADPAAHALQKRFIALARTHLPRLRRVLRNSSEPAQRAIAVTVIAYAPDKAAIVPDLVYAARDPDPDVRNAATRALWAVATLASARPDLGIRIDPTPFIEMLQSANWTDRNKALLVLGSLTERRDIAVLTALRKNALRPLAQAATWTEPGHAMVAYIILGRIEGLPDEAIFAKWTGGGRDETVRAMVDSIRSGRGR